MEWEKPEKLFDNMMKQGKEDSDMAFSHCDREDTYLTLHDCTADRAYFENGKLGFAFHDGFWVSPDHPDSHLSKVVRTDHAKVEYTLADGEDYDVTVYVFQKTLFRRVIRTEWTVQELVRRINDGSCKLEFLYSYFDGYTRIMECELTQGKKPYCRECVLRISAPEVSYYWNNLREDRPW